MVESGQLLWTVPPQTGQEVKPGARFRPGDVVAFLIPTEDRPIVLQNDGDEPLVLLTLTLTAVAAADATPVAVAREPTGTPASAKTSAISYQLLAVGQ